MKVNKFNNLQEKILSITALLYLVTNFIIWDVNYKGFSTISTEIYNTFTWIIIGVLLINIKKINFRNFVKEGYIFFLLIIILTINSSFISNGQISRVYIYSIIPVFILTILLFRLTSDMIIKHGLKVILLLFTIYNLLGIIGAIFKFDTFFGVIPNERVDNYRYSSILDNPNALGVYAFIAFFIITLYMVLNTKFKQRIVYALLYFITGLALIVSASRNSIVMIGIIYIVIIFYSRFLDKQLRKIIKYLNITGILVIILAFIIKGEFMINLLRLNQGLTGREDIWIYMLSEIKDNFVFGIGYNISNFLIEQTNLFDVSSPHNMYLGFLLDMGIIAFLILLLWIVKLIVKNHKLINQNSNKTKHLILYNSFYISYFIGQFFEFSFLKISAMNTFVLLVIALNMATIQSIKIVNKKKIKVTHLITGLSNGGAESMLYKILKYTNKTKFDLVVISMADEGYYGEKIKQLGINVVALNFKKPHLLIFNVFKLFKAINGTDVLQTWLYHANLFGLIVGKAWGIENIIWGIRQSNVDEENNKVNTIKIAKLSARLSKYVKYILSCSDEATNVHIKLGYEASKFKTIYNGFELDQYYLDEKANEILKGELHLEDEIVISNVARWDIQKDHPNLLKSINILYYDFGITNIKLLLCGSGMNEENKDLLNLIKKNKLENCVILLDIRSDINKIMSLSDIFVLSSLGEGFPNVLGEAMACNTPSVTTDVGDCRAIIGDYGIVVEKQNPLELATAIKTLIEMPKSDLEKLGLGSRLRIMQNYDIIQITKQYEVLYIV